MGNIVSFLDLQFLRGQEDMISQIDNLKERMINFQGRHDSLFARTRAISDETSPLSMIKLRGDSFFRL